MLCRLHVCVCFLLYLKVIFTDLCQCVWHFAQSIFLWVCPTCYSLSISITRQTNSSDQCGVTEGTGVEPVQPFGWLRFSKPTHYRSANPPYRKSRTRTLITGFGDRGTNHCTNFLLHIRQVAPKNYLPEQHYEIKQNQQT